MDFDNNCNWSNDFGRISLSTSTSMIAKEREGGRKSKERSLTFIFKLIILGGRWLRGNGKESKCKSKEEREEGRWSSSWSIDSRSK